MVSAQPAWITMAVRAFRPLSYGRHRQIFHVAFLGSCERTFRISPRRSRLQAEAKRGDREIREEREIFMEDRL